MDRLESKQLSTLLKAMSKAMLSDTDQELTDEDLVMALLGDEAEGDLARSVAVEVRCLAEGIIENDYSEEELAAYLGGLTWVKDDKDKSRVVSKWWRSSRDLIHFARLAQNSVKPVLENFKWDIITTTTSAGTSENICRISLKIRQADGTLLQTSFDADEPTLAEVVEIVSQIEGTVSEANGQ